MKLCCFFLQVALLSLAFTPVAVAQDAESQQIHTSKSKQAVIKSLLRSKSDIQRLSEIEPPYTNAQGLTHTSWNFKFWILNFDNLASSKFQALEPSQSQNLQTQQVNDSNETKPSTNNDGEILIDVEAERETFPQTSSPVYEITEEEIEKKKS